LFPVVSSICKLNNDFEVRKVKREMGGEKQSAICLKNTSPHERKLSQFCEMPSISQVFQGMLVRQLQLRFDRAMSAFSERLTPFSRTMVAE
jgi:hypothetical protein